MVALYSANCLAFQYSVLGQTLLAAIPVCDSLSAILTAALEPFLEKQVRKMQRYVNVYSGSGVRGDCNWDIAQRITRGTGERMSLTALPAWLGVDGALLDFPMPQPREDIACLLQSLERSLFAYVPLPSSAWVLGPAWRLLGGRMYSYPHRTLVKNVSLEPHLDHDILGHACHACHACHAYRAGQASHASAWVMPLVAVVTLGVAMPRAVAVGISLPTVRGHMGEQVTQVQ